MLGVLGGSISAACSGMIATIILSLVQGWQAVLSPIHVVLGVTLAPLTGLVSSALPRRGGGVSPPMRCAAKEL